MDTKNTKKFAFVLGREIELALAELKAVLDRFGFYFDIYSITENIAFANIDGFTENDAKKVIDTLGGTTKIFQILGSRSNKLDVQIADAIADNKTTESKLNFGISWYSKNKATDLFRFGLGIKKLLRSKELSVRLVESKEAELSTILSTKNDLDSDGIEVGVFDSTIGILRAVTNPYEWSKRDYDKPRADKHSGMVPPKLARMMVNLALGQIQHSAFSSQHPAEEFQNSKQSVILNNVKNPDTMGSFPARQAQGQDDKVQKELEIRNSKLEIPQHEVLVADPFCGSGNIVMEAMMLGCDVFGSDISEKAVEDTKVNIEWLKSAFGIQQSAYSIKEVDATTADFFDLLNAGDCMLDAYHDIAVVTEPFLGEPKKFMPSLGAARGEYEKVREIYIGFLKNLLKLRAQSSELLVCLVFPLVETVEGKRYSLWNESVDEIRNLGYTQIRSFIYGRDYQVVKREIVLLEYRG